jgi:putative peptidoglycan lipid II flippase
VGSLLGLGLPGPHAGLAAASSASAYLNAVLLYRGLRRNGTYMPVPGWGRLSLAVGAGCLAMGGALALWVPQQPAWLSLSVFNRVLDLFVYITLGALAYVLVAVLAGLRPAWFERGSL